jgi:hypothetical protein
VTSPTPIKEAPIDWARTVAWGDGGYYGRLFLNVKGREPDGTVDPSTYDDLRDEIAAKLEAMPGPDGDPLGTTVIRPQDAYPEVRGVAPDLLVYFGDLACLLFNETATSEIYTVNLDTDTNENNHDRTGVFVMAGFPASPPVGARAVAGGHGSSILSCTESTRPRGRWEGVSCERAEGIHRVVHRPVGAGKSTLAEMLTTSCGPRDARRDIDGDVVRTNLSKGLGSLRGPRHEHPAHRVRREPADARNRSPRSSRRVALPRRAANAGRRSRTSSRSTCTRRWTSARNAT